MAERSRRSTRTVAQPTNYKDFNEVGHTENDNYETEDDSTREGSSGRKADESAHTISRSRSRSDTSREQEQSDADTGSGASRSGGSATISFKKRSNKHIQHQHITHNNSRENDYIDTMSVHSDDLLLPQDKQRRSRGHATIANAKHDKRHTSKNNDKSYTSPTYAQPERTINRNTPITGRSRGLNTNKGRTTSAVRDHNHNRQGDNEGDEVDIAVDPNEDDLDLDTAGRHHPGGARPKSIQKRKTNANKTPKLTPKKQKVSVARRLANQNTPMSTPSCLKPLLFNDESFETERRKADRENQAAQQMLIHTQREAELAKTRREAEETRKKAIQLQKQVNRDNKKAAQDKARYSSMHLNTSAVNVQVHNQNRTQHSPVENAMEQRIQNAKEKARKLNPLRRARQSFTTQDGANNPNIDGQDNGLNAWLDYNLNTTELDDEIKHDVIYAKKNSDRNRCYNIDDIPIRGPPRDEDDIRSVISITDATNLANELLDDTNLYICRNTGMMKRKPEHQEMERQNRSRSRNERHPTSTVSIPPGSAYERQERSSTRWNDNGHRSHNSRRNNDRYDPDDHDKYMHDNGWDTEIEYMSDNSITNEKHIYIRNRIKMWNLMILDTVNTDPIGARAATRHTMIDTGNRIRGTNNNTNVNSQAMKIDPQTEVRSNILTHHLTLRRSE